MLINKRFDIGIVISPRAVVWARGRKPRANTTARGQITESISNLYLMTILLHNYYLFKRNNLKRIFHLNMFKCQLIQLQQKQGQ